MTMPTLSTPRGLLNFSGVFISFFSGSTYHIVFVFVVVSCLFTNFMSFINVVLDSLTYEKKKKNLNQANFNEKLRINNLARDLELFVRNFVNH